MPFSLEGQIHTAAGMAVVMEEAFGVVMLIYAVLAPFILDPAKNHVISSSI